MTEFAHEHEGVRSKSGAALGNAGLGGGVAAFGVSLCCVLPMLLMVAGLGGSWLAVFATVAAAGYWIAGVALVLLAAGWIFALRQRAGHSVRRKLAAGSLLAVLAWALLLFDSRINDMLIGWM